MLEMLKMPVFWIVLAVVAILIFGMSALKKYLKKIAAKCEKKEYKQSQPYVSSVKRNVAGAKKNRGKYKTCLCFSSKERSKAKSQKRFISQESTSTV